MHRSNAINWLGLAAIGWLWFVLISELRVEWSVNPQYAYGWAVPFLCACLIWENAAKRRLNAGHLAAEKGRGSSPFLFVLLCLSALLYAPTRLVLEANPGWRLFNWPLAVEVVVMTLGLVRLAFAETTASNLPARFRYCDFIFPLGFFLVAVPWPTWLEHNLIQGLTRLDADGAVELLGWLGIPAMAHGNVIEVATGPVGIDEACSGIRSFQAALMIALFLGEFYHLSVLRRAGLIFAGFALSLLFNLARMTLLVWIAATKGIAAVAAWHDPAGVTILLGCFFGLWGLGLLFRNSRPQMLKPKVAAETTAERTIPPLPRLPSLQNIVLAMLVWIVVTETGVESWYRWHEAKLPRASKWTVSWPTNSPAFKRGALPAKTLEILRYDEGQSASWSDSGQIWSAVFLRWNPGRTALHLAENHTPAVCLTAAGRTLKVISELQWFDLGGTGLSLRLPFAVYEVMDGAKPYYVFYCLWDDRTTVAGFKTMGLKFENRMASVLAGRRNPGQRSLEIALIGPANAESAQAALLAALPKIIAIEN
jgi:exosortase